MTAILESQSYYKIFIKIYKVKYLQNLKFCIAYFVYMYMLILIGNLTYVLYIALERTFEDHENVIEALSHWPKVHHNTLHFRYNPEKYLLLTKPQVWSLSSYL